jgi:hypothetical protein
MRNGEPLIYGGRIAADGLLGVPDLLRKSTGGYIPGDIKSGSGEEGAADDDSDGKPTKHNAVQLALYVDILERLGLSAGRRAFVWDAHGKDIVYDLEAPLGPHTPESLWDFYRDALVGARAIRDPREKGGWLLFFGAFGESDAGSRLAFELRSHLAGMTVFQFSHSSADR